MRIGFFIGEPCNRTHKTLAIVTHLTRRHLHYHDKSITLCQRRRQALLETLCILRIYCQFIYHHLYVVVLVSPQGSGFLGTFLSCPGGRFAERVYLGISQLRLCFGAVCSVRPRTCLLCAWHSACGAGGHSARSWASGACTGVRVHVWLCSASVPVLQPHSHALSTAVTVDVNSSDAESLILSNT